ncbi:osmoprotectant transport system permease protein [Rathayibacter tanaceti]|uniref:ABC transporter permease subunit n=3 Tax=Rathayibacter tanaceti TaxID=1671680 RepID=A0A166I3I4_9MICO|nr:Carnitine transport permease protein OpuCD [Rathayibacter tanaceti]QHC57114.1 ABC transporter permease subunit [Rathayibacter tanaceti]TCO36227.1 osmoprotectant transport system permease protein [Rathayibacter tanaceti]
MIDYLLDPAHWTGSDSIGTLLVQHLIYTGVSLLVAAVIGVPIGFYVGHTGKGTFLVAGVANALRALPTLGLIILLVIVIAPVFASDLAFVIPSLIVLVLLAIPPIMTNTYAGIRAVDAAAVDAAVGMGYRPVKVLFAVQVPCALPLILSGFRGATLQVISTATIAAYVSLGGLGRLIIDGRAQNDYDQMLAGAVLVAALALLVDLAIGLIGRFAVSPGLTRRRRRATAAQPVLAATATA